MSLQDNVTLGLLCLSFAATILVTIVATVLTIYIRHRRVRRQAELIQLWEVAPRSPLALPASRSTDTSGDGELAPVVHAWWTVSLDDMTQTVVLPRMTDDILTAEALRFEVTQVLQSVPWRPANEPVPLPRADDAGRRRHLDVVDGYARSGRHRAGPR